MDVYVKKFFDFIFSFLGFQSRFYYNIYFIRIAASNIATDDVTN